MTPTRYRDDKRRTKSVRHADVTTDEHSEPEPTHDEHSSASSASDDHVSKLAVNFHTINTRDMGYSSYPDHDDEPPSPRRRSATTSKAKGR